MIFWKYLLLLNKDGKQQEQGFTLPLVIGFGLFMIILAMSMIVRSSDDKANSTIQARTSSSVGVAESGLSRSLSLLNEGNTRYLLTRTYDPNNRFGGGNVNQWLNADGTTLTLTTNNTVACVTPGASTSSTVTVPIPTGLLSDTVNGSKYDLLAYSYSQASNIGTFLVQSQEQRASGDDAVTRLEADIQVSQMRTPITAAFPGLLADQFFAFGNNVVTVQGATDKISVICTTCTVDSSACVNGEPTTNALLTKYDIKSWTSWDQSQIDLKIAQPEVPPLPSPTQYTCNNISDITSDATLGATGATVTPNNPSADGTYAYCLDNISLSGTEVLTINSSSTNPVILFVNGNITISGNTSLQHNGGFQNFSIIGKADDGDSVADQTFVINGGSSTTNVFVYAPDAEFGINGGSTTPAVSGVIWAKTYGKSGSLGVGSSSAVASLEIPAGAGSALATRFNLSGYNQIASWKITTKSSGVLSWERKEKN